METARILRDLQTPTPKSASTLPQKEKWWRSHRCREEAVEILPERDGNLGARLDGWGLSDGSDWRRRNCLFFWGSDRFEREVLGGLRFGVSVAKSRGHDDSGGNGVLLISPAGLGFPVVNTGGGEALPSVLP